MQQERAGRVKGGKLEGGGAFLASSRNYWKFPLFSGRTVAGVELRGEINKVVELKLNSSSAEEKHLPFFHAQPNRFMKPKRHFSLMSLYQ